MVCVWKHVNGNGLSQCEWPGLPLLVLLHQAEHVAHHLPVFGLTGDVDNGGEKRQRSKVFYNLSIHSPSPWVDHSHYLSPSSTHLTNQSWYYDSNFSGDELTIFQTVYFGILESQRCLCNVNPYAVSVIFSQMEREVPNPTAEI